jgi:hypothetical protein
VIRLALRVRREHAELVLAELLELAPGGVEERSPADGVVEYAVYGAPGELPELPDLRAAAGLLGDRETLLRIFESPVDESWAADLAGDASCGAADRRPVERRVSQTLADTSSVIAAADGRSPAGRDGDLRHTSAIAY